MYIADLHIHSKYSRATSRDCDAPHLDLWARYKGISLIGTGDFTHPIWRQELAEALIPAEEEGLYCLREDMRMDHLGLGENFSPPRFVLSGEISSIYKKAGKTRKVHNVILLPSLEAAEKLSLRLEAIGNIHSDGRPILGLDSHDLLEITLETCPEALFIPAHIWTPHFSMFGAFSGFDSIEACFGDLAPHIAALETGLSSDPPMNWRVSGLDGYTLVSNSDAHSPSKLGREANLLNTELSYPALAHAIRTGEGFAGTLEFFPEEGKYHLDGHRNCGQCLTPAQTEACGGICPVCGKRITIGVQHRVEALADRPEGYTPDGAKPFESLAPLSEIIAEALGASSASKRVNQQYFRMIAELGPEFYILREAPLIKIERTIGPCVAEGIRRMRAGKVLRMPGYDGVFGKISLFDPEERESLSGQLYLFGPAESAAPAAAPPPDRQAPPSQQPEPAPKAAPPAAGLNKQQSQAACCADAAVAVIAGPGTGKTKTLVARIAHLVRMRGARPEEITAVTFTNQAAAELRKRIAGCLGKDAACAMHIGTFHSICLHLLDERPLLGENEIFGLLRDIMENASDGNIREAHTVISQIKNGLHPVRAAKFLDTMVKYTARLEELHARDLDDLLLDALKLEPTRMFTHLLVDEFQDLNTVQRQLTLHWAKAGESLFVIGDPDQSIYGFRGADASCFTALHNELPGLRTISLMHNYRSTPQILQCALPVISRNPGNQRVLIPHRSDGPEVRIMRAASSFTEAVWISKEIIRMTGGTDMIEAQTLWNALPGIRSFSDIAVLCRTRRQLALVESCLQHDSIPCIVSGRESYLDEECVRGAVAFFRSALNPRDIPALHTCLALVWHCAPAEIGEAATAMAQMDSINVAQLRELLKHSLPLAGWLDALEAYLPQIAQEKPAQLVARWSLDHGGGDALSHLRDAAVFYENMDVFLQALLLGEEADLSRGSGRHYDSGAVRLMTLHGAKGLEFPVVFLAGICHGMLPLERIAAACDVQEERRLFFVGMTRARDELIITHSDPPSSFLQELPSNIHIQAIAPPRRAETSEQLKLF